MVRCNLIPVCSDKVATHGVEFSHLSRNVFQIRHAFFVIFAMESSKSDTDTEQTFRRPSEPGPSFRAPEYEAPNVKKLYAHSATSSLTLRSHVR